MSRLKQEYGKHLKTLGSTGAGLNPEDVAEGSPMANIVGAFGRCSLILLIYLQMIHLSIYRCGMAMVERAPFILA